MSNPTTLIFGRNSNHSARLAFSCGSFTGGFSSGGGDITACRRTALPAAVPVVVGAEPPSQAPGSATHSERKTRRCRAQPKQPKPRVLGEAITAPTRDSRWFAVGPINSLENVVVLKSLLRLRCTIIICVGECCNCLGGYDYKSQKFGQTTWHLDPGALNYKLRQFPAPHPPVRCTQ